MLSVILPYEAHDDGAFSQNTRSENINNTVTLLAIVSLLSSFVAVVYYFVKLFPRKW